VEEFVSETVFFFENLISNKIEPNGKRYYPGIRPGNGGSPNPN